LWVAALYPQPARQLATAAPVREHFKMTST
jgi:hypothetical protein